MAAIACTCFLLLCDITTVPFRPKSKSYSQNFEVSWKNKFRLSWKSCKWVEFQNLKSLPGLLCINTKHNKVRITQSQRTSRKHAYWRSLQGLSGKWKWGRQMAQPWKPLERCKSLGHNSYTSHIIEHFVLKFQHFRYYGSKGQSL